MSEVHKQKILDCDKCYGLNIPKISMSAAGQGKYAENITRCFVIGQCLHAYYHLTSKQIPFCGPRTHTNSGILLYKALKQAGFCYSKRNLFVTNLVKCHCPKHRVPSNEELLNCKPYLLEELQLMKPNIIVCLGSFVQKAFDLPKPIGTFVTSITRGGLAYISSVHPSYIRRSNRKYEPLYIQQLSEEIKKYESKDK